MFQKTYQQFISEAEKIGRHMAALLDPMGGLRGNPADPETQKKLEIAKKLDAEEEAKRAKKISDQLHFDRTHPEGRGMYGNYGKELGLGWMRIDPRTGKKIFTPKKDA